MKEQWKRLDTDAKLLVNVEEGRSQPLKIELPLSALRPNGDFCCNKVLTVLRVFFLLLLLVILGCTGVTLFLEPYYPTESTIIIENDNLRDSISDQPLLRSEENKLAFRNKVYASRINVDDIVSNNVDESKESHDVAHQEVIRVDHKLQHEVTSGELNNDELDELKSTFEVFNNGMREMSENIKNLNQISQDDNQVFSKELDKDLKDQEFLVNMENLEVDKPTLLDVFFRQVIQITDSNLDTKEDEAQTEQSNFNIEEWRQLAKEKIKEMARIQEENFSEQLENLAKESDVRDHLIHPVTNATKLKEPQLMFIDHLIRDLMQIDDSKSVSVENKAESEEENFKKLVKTINESRESSEMFDKIENDDDLLSLLMYFYTKTDLTNVESNKESNESVEKEEVRDENVENEASEVNQSTQEEIVPNEEPAVEKHFDKTFIEHLMSDLMQIGNNELEDVEEKKENEDEVVEDLKLNDESEGDIGIVPFVSLSSVVIGDRDKSVEKLHATEESEKLNKETTEDSFEFPHLVIGPQEEINESLDESTEIPNVEEYEIDRDTRQALLLAKFIDGIDNENIEFNGNKIDFEAINKFIFGTKVQEVRSNARNVFNMIKSALSTTELQKAYEKFDNENEYIWITTSERQLFNKINYMFSVCRQFEDDTCSDTSATYKLMSSNASYILYNNVYYKNYSSRIREPLTDSDEEATKLSEGTKAEMLTQVTGQPLENVDITTIQSVQNDENNNEQLTNNSEEQSAKNLIEFMENWVQIYKGSQKEEEPKMEIESEKTIGQSLVNESTEKHKQEISEDDLIDQYDIRKDTETEEEPRVKMSNEESTTNESDAENVKNALKSMADVAEFIQNQTADVDAQYLEHENYLQGWDDYENY